MASCYPTMQQSLKWKEHPRGGYLWLSTSNICPTHKNVFYIKYWTIFQNICTYIKYIITAKRQLELSSKSTYIHFNHKWVGNVNDNTIIHLKYLWAVETSLGCFSHLQWCEGHLLRDAILLMPSDIFFCKQQGEAVNCNYIFNILQTFLAYALHLATRRGLQIISVLVYNDFSDFSHSR